MATDISEDMEVSENEVAETVSDAAVEGVALDDTSPEVPVEAAETSSAPSLAQQVSELGFTDVADDADARYRLLEHYQQLQDANNQWSEYNQRQQQEQQARQQQYQQYQQQQYYAQQQAQQQQTQQQAQPEEPTGPVQDITGVAHWWNPPGTTLDELERYRENKVHPETGEIYTDWKEGTPTEIMQGAEQHVGYLEQWANDIIRNPQKVLPNIIEQEFDKLFADRYSALIAYNTQQSQEQQQQQYQQQYGEYKEKTIQDITSRNADWLYQANPLDNQPLRDNFGQLVLSPQGEVVTKYINYFRGMGIDDPSTLWDLATRMYSGDISTAEPQVQQQQVGHVQQQVQQPPVGDTLRQATHIPSAGGSVPSGSDPSPYSQNPHESAGEKLRQQALTDGLF